jgi:general secretion pathway protein N
MAVIRVIRSFGLIFVICSVFAARAVADPIDERVDFRPQSEARPAAGTNGVTETSGLSKTPRAADPVLKSRAGNPLWTVPLSALPATRDRPLFSTSRRPPIVAVPAAASLPQTQETPAPPPERPLLTLVGTIVSREASIAVVQGSSNDAISRLRLGQQSDGWRVQGINLRSIVVEKAAQSVKLDLPKPSAPAQ